MAIRIRDNGRVVVGELGSLNGQQQVVGLGHLEQRHRGIVLDGEGHEKLENLEKK